MNGIFEEAGLTPHELWFHLGALSATMTLLDGGKIEEARRALGDTMVAMAEKCPEHMRQAVGSIIERRVYENR